MIALWLAAQSASALTTPPPDHVEAARIAAEEFNLEPELLLAISFLESNHTSSNVSRVRGRSMCGPLQVRADSVKHCKQMQDDLVFGYHEGARVLVAWISAAHGDLATGLRGFGCGWEPNAKPARPMDQCRRYDRRVMALRNRYRALAKS